MRVHQSELYLSATDLANHLSCGHLTALDLRLAKNEIAEPSWENPHLRVFQKRGMEHERAYIESLRATGLRVLDLAHLKEEPARIATVDAIERGEQAIVQGSLVSGRWRGRTDVLLRVPQPCNLGEWSYEVVDCKLARETKAETILQLCLYSDLLAELQGRAPERFHVIRPNAGFEPESYRFAAYAAYYRKVKGALEAAVENPGGETYPEPVNHCEICRWWKECDRQRRSDDHLSYVAGASRLHRKELVAQGVPTLEALAKLALPIPFAPARGARESYARIREQARLQFESRTEGRLKFEMLAAQAGEGISRLPAPSPGDIFLDFEGDPFVGDGGLEYLFGVVTDGAYQGRWALNRAQERAAFEWFIDFTSERLTQFPDLHIYHFGAYEPGAIKRLMLRYVTREEEVDRLLRGRVFVDLHNITKQAVRAGVEQYSLKELEKFCNYLRAVPLAEANRARHIFDHQLELDASPEPSSVVERYNEDDCRATSQLRDWLESLRSPEMPRPGPEDPEPSEQVSAHQARVAALFEALTGDLPSEPKDRTPEQAARWLLAHALDWHRREDKVKWWEFYRMQELAEEDLYDEKTALAGLTCVRRMPKTSPRERSPIDQYRYPPQECTISQGDKLHTLDKKRFGEVVAIDTVACTIDVKKPVSLESHHPTAIFEHTSYPTTEQTNSLLRLADRIVANGIEGPGDYQTARDLLLRKPPCSEYGPVLPIQGPPGAGKTFTGAKMICDLLANGKKVGVTAVSHKVIRHLLDGVVEQARTRNLTGVACGHVVKEAASCGGPIEEFDSHTKALDAVQSGSVNVLGATSWVWARETFRDAVHVLFVDEAGQMSLANVLACAPAASNLVLIGDPQQLEQPQKGSHPEGSDISALEHLLEGRRTISEEQGKFLAETWRLHPKIASFTSEMFYEGRLHPRDGLERQRIDAGSGLWFVPVIHEGNQSYSAEEVEQVARIVEFLTRPGSTWTDCHGIMHALTRNDVLIVAPYNHQVSRLADRLRGARIGTVDKFQGQQAAVVLYSMTTSSAEDAPRGMEFLYNLNRFNVATSRARCACIVIGSPRLLWPECRTPRQMELANALCRYVELSQSLPSD